MMSEKETELPLKVDVRHSIVRTAVFALLAGMPLFMTNRYFNITVSKFAYFAVISAMCFIVCLLLKDSEGAVKGSGRLRNTDIAFIGFLGCALISALISDYGAAAFLGSSGRCMGFFYILLLGGLYFTVTRFYLVHTAEITAFVISFLIVGSIAFIQFFGFDFLNLYQGVSKNTQENFLSTIGNINVASSFICLCLPFIMNSFCFTKRKWKLYLLYFGCIFGFCFLVISNSDSGYLGLFCVFWVLGIFLTGKRRNFHRLFFLAAGFLISTKLVYFLSCLTAGYSKELSELGIIFGESELALPLAAIFILCGFILMKIKISKPIMSIIKIGFIAVPVLLFVMLIAAILYFTLIDTKASLGELENYLRFNDAWATGRGKIWRMTMESYSELPFIKKLFGCGPDTLMELLKINYDAQMQAAGVYTDNAHNEFMQYLVTHGIAGLGFYLVLLVLSMRNCLRQKENIMLYKGLFLSIFCYAAQSVVNISQPLTTPIFFLLMFIALCDYPARVRRRQRKEENLKNLEINVDLMG